MTTKLRRACILALVALNVTGGAAALMAQTAPTLDARIFLRPMNNDDTSAYKLAPAPQRSAGLSTVGIGQPAYLEVLVNKAIPAEQIAGVTWELASRPSTSKAELVDGPIGMDVPTYEPSDRAISQVAGRKMLRPDVPGQYTVTATVSTVSAGKATLRQIITGATYVGIKACGTCHSIPVGTESVSKAASWSQTVHSKIFKDGMNGVASDHYGQNCLPCHTVGYDADPAAAGNGGFADLAKKLNWTFPTVMKEGTYDTVPEALRNVGNIQCENCHGPGSQHVVSGGNKTLISVSMGSGDCGQCHGALNNHYRAAEWANSRHASATRSPSGAGREGCVGCHTGLGFMERIRDGQAKTVDYVAINCQTCHDPHGQTNDTHLVRNPGPVSLLDGTAVPESAGKGALCMTCHQSRQHANVYAATTAGTARFGPHHSPQADMLVGSNGYSYGLDIPGSAHVYAVDDSCVGCHMQPMTSAITGFTRAGGHTFNVKGEVPGKGTVELVGECQKCHGPRLKTFDFPLLDYDGDGKIDGVQTEVQHLLDKLSALLPPVGTAKTSLTIDAKWTPAQLKGSYNWQFVNNDGSRGIHNTAYAVGLLKASIADLSRK